MPINVDWLGDGWTYYTEEERALMARKPAAEDITEWRQVPIPATREQQLELGVAICSELRCVMVPITLLDTVIAAVPNAMCGKSLSRLQAIRDEFGDSIRMADRHRAAKNN